MEIVNDELKHYKINDVDLAGGSSTSNTSRQTSFDPYGTLTPDQLSGQNSMNTLKSNSTSKLIRNLKKK